MSATGTRLLCQMAQMAPYRYDLEAFPHITSSFFSASAY